MGRLRSGPLAVPALETLCREEESTANPTGKREPARVAIQVVLGDP